MAKFSKKMIEKIQNNKPIMYTLKRSGRPIYVGVAKRGRGQERLFEHLGEIPSTEFSTRSYDSISNAREAEEKKIKREKPKYNDQYKG